MQPEIPTNWPQAPLDGRSQLMRSNFYEADSAFRAMLNDRLGEHMGWLEPRLHALGQLSAERVDEWATICDQQTPVLVQYDHLGQRIDRLDAPREYRLMEEVAYGDAALVAMKYDPKIRERRGDVIHTMGFALGYVFGQAETGLYCPVCMTDGVARLLERYGPDEVRERFLRRLVVRDAGALWQGTMYLTEKQGGSDVGANVCHAEPIGDAWRLYGEKWFCSNVGGRAILALARPEGAPPGTKGLGLFFVPLEVEGRRNGIEILRVKDKMGVRSMPTGEIRFDGALAFAVGDLSAGFKQMAEMLNLSRLYNTVAAVAVSRRALAEARAWLTERKAFGQPLLDAPLLRENLAGLLSDHLAALYLSFETVGSLDRVDAAPDDAEAYALMRLRVPLAKRWTGSLAVAQCSAAMELVGGNGYINDFVMPRLLRDAQVLPIWEGTSNILALDMLRTMAKEKGHEPFLARIGDRLATAAGSRLELVADGTNALVRAMPDALERVEAMGPRDGQALAGHLADRLTALEALSLLVEAAANGSDGPRCEAAAVRFYQRHLAPRSLSGLPDAPVSGEDFEALLA